MEQIRPRKQVSLEMLERAIERIWGAQDLAAYQHGMGAFANAHEFITQLEHQLEQFKDAVKNGDLPYARRQVAQMGQLSQFQLASMETWSSDAKD